MRDVRCPHCGRMLLKFCADALGVAEVEIRCPKCRIYVRVKGYTMETYKTERVGVAATTH